MVASGIALYVPYVAFHTTFFERLVASARLPGNLGFLMYLADSLGYLGYAVIIVLKSTIGSELVMLPVFNSMLIGSGVACAVCMVLAVIYFQRRLTDLAATEPATITSGPPIEAIPKENH